jgi:hypothetical protein
MGQFSPIAPRVGLGNGWILALSAALTMLVGCGGSSAPTAVTGPALGVAATFATLTGTVTTGSDASYHFDYGPTPRYGFSTAAVAAGGSGRRQVEAGIYAALRVGTVYHYRLVVTGDVGGRPAAAYGNDRRVRTRDCTRSARAGVNLATFVNSLAPGAVGCLHAGAYGSVRVSARTPNARGTITDITLRASALHPVEVMGYPGERPPTIVGTMVLLGGSYVTLSGVWVHGPTGDVGNGQCDDTDETGQNVLVWVYGTHDQLDHSQVDGDLCHAGVYVGSRTGWPTPSDARVLANHIHDNGDFGDAGQAHLDHGAYVAEGPALIANNVIEHNLTFGIQLYPNPIGTVTIQNTVVDNGEAGILLGSDGSSPPPSANEIAANISAYNGWNAPEGGFGIRSGSDHALGSGNVARGNVLYANVTAAVDDAVGGLGAVGNIAADPRFTGSVGSGPSAYTTSGSSAAIDAAVGSQPQDYRNHPRGPDAADVGAFENILR